MKLTLFLLIFYALLSLVIFVLTMDELELFLGLVSGSKESLDEAVSDALEEIGAIAEGSSLLSVDRCMDACIDGVREVLWMD